MWANPFRFARFGHARSISLHRLWLAGELTPRMLRRLGFGEHERLALERLRRRVLRRIALLSGRDLQCWCPLTSKICHAETLLALANPPETQ